MARKPCYTPKQITSPAFHLRYAWTGWPSQGEFDPEPSANLFAELDQLWELDGIRRLETTWSTRQIQIICSAKPTVSPLFFTARVKGRLQHALRQVGQATAFSRKVSFRTVGDNRREHVEAYIAKQVTKERFVDEEFSKFMRRFTVSDATVRLQEPTETKCGRYWYNLHLVLVTNSRMRFNDEHSLDRMHGMCAKIALKKRYLLAIRSVMPDHLHIALRGNLEHSPEDIALAFMNNLAFAFGQKAIWQSSYYVGSFGEYDMGAVRNAISCR